MYGRPTARSDITQHVWGTGCSYWLIDMLDWRNSHYSARDLAGLYVYCFTHIKSSNASVMTVTLYCSDLFSWEYMLVLLSTAVTLGLGHTQK